MFVKYSTLRLEVQTCLCPIFVDVVVVLVNVLIQLLSEGQHRLQNLGEALLEFAGFASLFKGKALIYGSRNAI